MNYVLLSIVFVFGGALVYQFDKRVILGWFFKTKTKGLVIERSLKWRAIFALVLVIIFNYFWNKGQEHKEIQWVLVDDLFEVFSIVLGLYLAPWLLKIIPKKVKKAGEYIEKLEKGEKDPINDLKRAVVKEGAKAVVSNLSDDESTEESEDSSSKKEPLIVKKSPTETPHQENNAGMSSEEFKRKMSGIGKNNKKI